MDACVCLQGAKTLNEYAVLKLIHIGALIFWLGPALGAWLVLKALENNVDINNNLLAKVSKTFFLTVILEHIAFIVLLITGFILAFRYGFLNSGWLNQKLIIVLFIIVPLEIIDVLLGNWVASQASRKLYAGQSISRWEQSGLEIYHGAFTKTALVIIPISVVVIMYLAMSKSVL